VSFGKMCVAIILPVAASTDNGPTVKPLCTTKLLFAMVPYSPMNEIYYSIYSGTKKIAPEGAIYNNSSY
jgi:hypothetical protein